jgi:bidirectional [NiFe] hydrogenase diaphorase subunit
MIAAKANKVNLTVDGQPVTAVAGTSLLQIAEENGLFIPTLCRLSGLSDVGACRLCLVEIKGSGRLMPACMTQATDGMEVVTRSERLDRYRRMVLELLFAERNHVCAVCVANGRCELQDLAARLGMDHVRFPYRHPELSVDLTHARFGVDHNRCILCTRCVRVCDEVEGAHTWDIAGRGVHAKAITDLDQPWGEALTCTSCGKCVQVCPTGALFEKGRAVGEVERHRGFLPYLLEMREGRS